MSPAISISETDVHYPTIQSHEMYIVNTTRNVYQLPFLNSPRVRSQGQLTASEPDSRESSNHRSRPVHHTRDGLEGGSPRDGGTEKSDDHCVFKVRIGDL
jgi:hypothetical protein